MLCMGTFSLVTVTGPSMCLCEQADAFHVLCGQPVQHTQREQCSVVSTAQYVVAAMWQELHQHMKDNCLTALPSALSCFIFMPYLHALS